MEDGLLSLSESGGSQARSGFGPHVCVSHCRTKLTLKKLLFIYYHFGVGCPGSLLYEGFLQLWGGRAPLGCSVWASRCSGFSCGAQGSMVCGHHWLQHMGSVVIAHGLSCSMVCGIFLDQGSNPCPLHWQVIVIYRTTREAQTHFLSLKCFHINTFIRPSIHPFIHPFIFMFNTYSIQLCVCLWKYSNEQSNHSACLHRVQTLGGKKK